MFGLIHNIPDAFAVKGFYFQMLPGTAMIRAKYNLAWSEHGTIISNCQKRRNKIIQSCTCEDVYSIILAVHDMFARNVKYADEGNLSHTMVYPLTKKETYAMVFRKHINA